MPNSDLPTYFVEGKALVKSAPQDSGAQPNLAFLGPSGVTKLASGVTVGYLTGVPEDVDLSVFSDKQVDILITYQWPAAIASEEKLTAVGNAQVDEVVKMTKPRYHFAVGTETGRFFERPPYKWSFETHQTRFISLGQQGSGDRWFYAFSYSRDSEASENCTENPFEEAAKSSAKAKSSETALPIAKKQKVVSPQQCFFCLSNPLVETHMIFSVGQNSYLTIAKGPLTKATRDLGFSGHGIIIPIEHIPCINKANRALISEMEDYKSKIIRMFQSLGRGNYSVAFFEINRKANVHFHIQFMPVATALLKNFDTVLESRVKRDAKFTQNAELEFHKSELDDETTRNKLKSGDYIEFTLADSPTHQTFYTCRLQDGSVDLQFPRKVLAHLMNAANRIHWTKCQKPYSVEIKEAQSFKEVFKSFDSI